MRQHEDLKTPSTSATTTVDREYKDAANAFVVDDFQSELYRTREDRARALASSEPAADTLATLAALHADGVLTDEEFASKKAKLLDEI